MRAPKTAQSPALCKRCLLQDSPQHEYYQGVLHYRRTLAAHLRCPDDVYQQRLDACCNCDQLVNGVCMQCGCYVQMRAAVNNRHCPLKQARW